MKSESNFPVSLAASSSEVHSLQRTIFRCSELWRFLEDLNFLKLKKTFAVAKYPSRSELWRFNKDLTLKQTFAVAEEEVVFMRLFPHSLIGKAKDWYLDQATETMTNWNVLE